jgi:hypothetical protein
VTAGVSNPATKNSNGTTNSANGTTITKRRATVTGDSVTSCTSAYDHQSSSE